MERDGWDVKKSMAAIASRWFLKKQATVWLVRDLWALGVPAGDGPLGNIEAQHQKFTVDARSAPGWVFRHHPKDQITNFLRNPFSADHPIGSRDETPIECESAPVPTHNGLRAYDNPLVAIRTRISARRPKRAYQTPRSWSGMSRLQYGELLAKGEVFQKQPSMSVEEPPHRPRQEPNGVNHVVALSHSACGWQRVCC